MGGFHNDRTDRNCQAGIGGRLGRSRQINWRRDCINSQES